MLYQDAEKDSSIVLASLRGSTRAGFLRLISTKGIFRSPDPYSDGERPQEGDRTARFVFHNHTIQRRMLTKLSSID